MLVKPVFLHEQFLLFFFQFFTKHVDTLLGQGLVRVSEALGVRMMMKTGQRPFKFWSHGVLEKLLLQLEIGVLLEFQVLSQLYIVYFQNVLFLCDYVNFEYQSGHFLLRVFYIILVLDWILPLFDILFHFLKLNP